MTIKQYGGVFGRNPTFNNATIDGTLTVDQIVEKTSAAGITLDGVTLKDGNVVLANGKGIDFSATAGTGTSELFDDYEEGTWTPASASITLATASGTYTKIGDTVHAYFAIVFPTTADANSAQLTGLPFTSGTNTRNGAALGFVVDSGTAYTLLAFTSLIQIYNRSGSLTTNANNSAKQYYGVLTYKVA